MDCIVHGVAKSQTGLSDFQFTFSGSEGQRGGLAATALLGGGGGGTAALLGPHSGLQDEAACTSAAVGFMGSAN